jgi:hypothetical protein
MNDKWAIIDYDTIETKFGWLFHTDSRLYSETGNSRYRIVGSYGHIVERKTGYIAGVATIVSRRYCMRVYEYNRTHSLFSGLLSVWYCVLDHILPELFYRW